MHLDLTGKKIIVTGASSGIGFAISESLLKSGATVALHYNSGKNGIELLLEKYKNAIAYHADLSKTENCISLFEKIEKEFCSTNIHYYSQKQIYSVEFLGFNIEYDNSEYGDNKIKILYDSCVKFINFYNKQKEE